MQTDNLVRRRQKTGRIEPRGLDYLETHSSPQMSGDSELVDQSRKDPVCFEPAIASTAYNDLSQQGVNLPRL